MELKTYENLFFDLDLGVELASSHEDHLTPPPLAFDTVATVVLAVVFNPARPCACEVGGFFLRLGVIY